MKNWLTATALLLLAACATSASDPGSASSKRRIDSAPPKMVRTSDCMFQSSISGFDAIDNHHIVLYSGGRRQAYLAEISGACFSLKNQSALASIDGDSNGRICGYGRDAVAYRDFGQVERCHILALEKLSDLRRYEVLGVGPPTPKDKDSKDQDSGEDDGE